MAATILQYPLLLPHELMSPAMNPPLSPCNSTPDRSEKLPSSYLPHQITSENKTPVKTIDDAYKKFKPRSHDDDPCKIILTPKFAPSSSEASSITIRFKLEDRTELKQFASKRGVFYSYLCPLTGKPFVRGFVIKTSRFRPLKIKTDNHPVKRQHVDYFESKINSFASEILDAMSFDAKRSINVDVDARACIERIVWYDEAMDIMKEIESEGVGKDSGADVGGGGGGGDCAVCLDAVEMRWFDGMKLPCDHVFHVKCISPWLEMKSTCPMCRRELPVLSY